MTTVKGLAIVALLFGGTSIALAQNAPNVTTGPTGAPAYTPQPNIQAANPSGHAIKHHKKMHMSAKGQPHKKMYMSARSHKGSKLTPTSNAKPQTKQ